jgi:acyl carrier protein
MSEDDIKAAIFAGLRKIAPEADPASLRPGDKVREVLDIDSFDFLNFLIGLHEKLHVEIPETDYGKLTTLGEMVAYLSARTERP